MVLYQSIILDPQRNTMYVASIKKGPKGIWDFIFLLLRIREGLKNSVPRSEAKKITRKLFIGVPANNPNKKPIFTSPPPIHLPLDMINKIQKNPNIIRPDKIASRAPM